jgi:hypothetical protein
MPTAGERTAEHTWTSGEVVGEGQGEPTDDMTKRRP